MRSLRAVLFSLVALSWLLNGPIAGASTGLLDLHANVDQTATTFLLRLDSSAQFSPVWVSPRVFALDMTEVTTDRSSKPQVLDSPLVSNYRLLSYSGSGGVPHLLLELELKEDAKVEAVQSGEGIEVTVRSDRGQNSKDAAQNLNAGIQPVSATAPAKLASVRRGNVIREIQVAKLQGTSALEVNIVGNGSLEYRTMQLSNPDRLVLDIPNVRNQIRERQLPVNASPLRNVRVGQLSRTPLVSRVVMDLDSKTAFQVRPQTNALVVTLGESGAKPVGEDKGANSSRTASAAPLQQPLHSESKASSMSAKAAQPTPQPARNERKSDEPKGLTPKQAATPETVLHAVPADIAKTAASDATTVRNDVPLQQAALEIPAGTPSQKNSRAALFQNAPSSMAQASAASVGGAKESFPETPAIPARQEARVLLAQQNMPAPASMPSPPSSGIACQGAPYTGEPISVNLKDVDLKDFFRLVHEISSLNIVLDPDVSGSLTIVLDEIPWDQAMGIVLKNNHLVAQCEGNVVRIAKTATVEAEAKQVSETALAQEAAQPLTPQPRTLNYAKAGDLVTTLKRFLSARGDIIADPRTNTLIIKDIPDRIAQIDTLLPILDRKSQQVEIEARVVAASRSFARDIGIQLAASGLTGNIILGGAGVVGTSPINRGTVPPLFVGSPPAPPQPGQPPTFANVAQPLLTNMAASGPSSGFSFLLTAGNNFALDAIITAAESKGIGKLLSRPKIITQNNVEATVKQGVRIPIQTTINNTVSVQYVDVVLRLTVTPQITLDGTIFLKTDIENTSIDPGIATTPGQFGLDTQAATTQVLVTNGGTVFFGGVVQTVNRINQTEVPLLGSVPLIGNLFKHKSTTSTSNELLFFITPKIVQS